MEINFQMWEPVDPIVADPDRTTRETIYSNIYGNSFLNYTEGGDRNSQYSYLVVIFWKKGKDPHPQDKIQHLDFTKDPRPLYYKTPPCVFYHKNVRSKTVFGP